MTEESHGDRLSEEVVEIALPVENRQNENNSFELSNKNEEIKKIQTTDINTKEDKDKSKNNDLLFIDKFISWGYVKSSKRTIDTVILHSSYDALGSDPYSLNGLLNEYKLYGVAPHYLIDRQGNIYRLVEEKDVAYHAGESRVPDGRTGVNNFSIGIELMNKKDDNFTSKQYNSLNELLKYLLSRYKIKYVLGHNQISPGRKTDPWNFDWEKIYK